MNQTKIFLRAASVFSQEKFKHTHHSNLASHLTGVAPVYDLCGQKQILYRNQMKYLKSKLCFENYFRPVSIANCVQAILLRAAQLRIVGLEAAIAEVPLDEQR